jgi:alpha-tubulin suppressor-like RCC1 family protein
MRRLICSVTFAAMLAAPGIANGAVLRWGSYGNSNWGKNKVPKEVQFVSEPGPLVKIDAGNAESYALGSDGTEWAFGQNHEGQLGNGTVGNKLRYRKAAPVHFPAGTHIVAIGEGRAAGFAIDSSGQGWSWGRSPEQKNNETEGSISSLCLGPVEEPVSTPEQVPGLTGVRAVQGGGTHVLWLTDEGTVKACGANQHGQLGDGTTTSSLTPVTVQGLPEVVEISSGKGHSCARTASGEVFVWGDDVHGQVGNGEFRKGISLPYHVPLPGPASEISCGGNGEPNGSTMVLVEGVIYGWGADEVDQVGDGQNTDKSVPTLATETLGLSALEGGITQVVTSGESSLALMSNGNVYGWGSNRGWALAMPEDSMITASPFPIATEAVEISGTSYDALARTP